MKSLVTWVIVAAWSVLCFLVTLPAMLWLPFDRDRHLFHRIARLWGRSVSRHTPTFTLETRGTAPAASDGPYVVVMNHVSRIDPVFILSLPIPLRMVVKSELLRSPLGLNLRLAGYIGTRRGGPDDAQRVLDRGLDWLARGVSVMLFPEGRRSPDGRVGRFKRGAFEMAARAGVPILPVVVAGSDDVQSGGSLRFQWGQHVVVSILPPIEADSSDALREASRRVIAQHLAELRGELRETRGQGRAWETSVSTTSTR